MSKVTMAGSSFGHYNTNPQLAFGYDYSGVSPWLLFIVSSI